MSRLLALALLASLAAPASAQWTRVDTNYGVADVYATNLVAGGATHVYATVLAGQPVPNRFLILRSADDGGSWTEVFSGYNGGARGYGLGETDGAWTVLVRGNGETALLASTDGATWAETATRVPTATSTSVARRGATYVVVGGNPSYRSADGGATWAPVGTGQPMGYVLAFGDGFYALSGIGQLFRLDGEAWTAVPFGSPFATSLFAEGGRLWAKAAAGPLYASADGAAWAAQPTDQPTAWNSVLTTSNGPTPWFLPGIQDVFVSGSDGASIESVAATFPTTDAGAPCTGNYGASATAAFANVLCSFTDASRNGLYRRAFGATSAGAPGPNPAGLTLQVLGTPTSTPPRVALTLDAPHSVSVALFDVQGRAIARLTDGPRAAGTHALRMPAGLAPGLYVVRATAAGQAVARTLTVVR